MDGWEPPAMLIATADPPLKIIKIRSKITTEEKRRRRRWRRPRFLYMLWLCWRATNDDYRLHSNAKRSSSASPLTGVSFPLSSSCCCCCCCFGLFNAPQVDALFFFFSHSPYTVMLLCTSCCWCWFPLFPGFSSAYACNVQCTVLDLFIIKSIFILVDTIDDETRASISNLIH